MDGAEGQRPTEGAGRMREERRIVTALFADIVGSTSIAERLDPEDSREIIGAAIAIAVEQVDALGGTVKDLAGDGVLALFGAPVAHEDDAERAVLCGLRIVRAIDDHAVDVAERWGVEGLSVRVGIETGRAVMGPVGGGSRVEYGATGDVVNTAARLQSHAEPGTVLVGGVTRSMAEDRFTWGSTASLELKGKERVTEATPVLAYAAQRHATAGVAGAPLVGRTREVETLVSAVTGASRQRGSLVVLVGEAGVGKSRLIEETRARSREAEELVWLEAPATSYGITIPYLPFRHLLLTWLGLPLSARRDEVIAAVESRGIDVPEVAREALHTLLPVLTGAHDVGGDPEAAQARVFAAAEAWVTALASERPVVLVLEDLHWCDPTTVSLIERLVGKTVTRSLLVLVTTRPEAPALDAAERLAGLASDRAIRIDLPPLSREGDRELLRALVGASELPRPLEERILDTTDGNPFFVEEQVRALVMSGSLTRTDGAWNVVDATGRELAPTVERALLARIDRLPDVERDTLLAASVLGVRFDEPTLRAVTGNDPSGALGELERLGFVEPLPHHDGGGDRAYRFRHALSQEAASASLLRRQKRLLHGRAAVALTTAYAGREDEIAARLGRHLAEAGETEAAVGYLLTAARSALASYANEEAASIAHDARALQRGPDGVVDPTQRGVAIELASIEGTALRALARYDGSIEAHRASLGSLEPGERILEARTRATIGQILVDAHRYDEALEELEAAEGIATEDLDDDEAFDVWLDVQLSRGSVFYWRADTRRYSELLQRVGPLVQARGTERQRMDYFGAVRTELLRRDGFAVRDELLRVDELAYELGRRSDDEEARAWAAFVHGFVLMWHRDLDEAEPFLRESLTAAERLGSALLRSRALTYLMVTQRLRGDVARASALVEAVRAAATEADLPEYEAMTCAVLAWAAYRQGDLDEVLREGSRAIDVWEGLPNRYPVDWLAAFPLLAVALDRQDVEAARRCAEAMLAEGQQPLPERLAEPLRAGAEAARSGGTIAAWESFAVAVDRAIELVYL